MDSTAALKAGRRAAETLFIDTVKIERGDGEPVFNPDTGQYESPAVLVWQGKAKFQSTGGQAKNPVAGQVQFTVQSMELHLPSIAGPVQIDDTVTIITAPLDPVRIGETLRVIALHRKTYATAQRLKVERVS